MKTIKAAVLGCGDRGCIYADYALRNPNDMEIVAVADINELHREEARVRYSLPKDRAFDGVESLIASGIACDIVIDATMDRAHYPTAMALLQAKYDVLLEKPVCPNKDELLELRRAAHENGCRLIVCHVLRYTPFYSAVKKVISDGKIGRVRSMEMTEHVGMAHFIDSFVRGKWNSEEQCGSGLLLAKCCHDMDLMCWLGDASRPKYVTSLGFRENFSGNFPGLRVQNLDGTIVGTVIFEENQFELRIFTRENDRYSYDTETVSTLEHSDLGKHGGGDNEMMRHLVEYLRTGRPTASLTSIDTSIDGHLCVYAAEISRKEGRTVTLEELERS